MLLRGGDQTIDQRGVDKRAVDANMHDRLRRIAFQGGNETAQAVLLPAHKDRHVGRDQFGDSLSRLRLAAFAWNARRAMRAWTANL